MSHAIVEYAIPKVVQEAIQDNIDSMARATERSSVLRQGATFLAKIHSKFGNYVSYVYLNNYYTASADIHVNTPGFTVEASPTLSKLLEYLSEEYKTDPVSDDYPNEAKREYCFNPTDDETHLMRVRVVAALIEGDGLCQRVVTGTHKESRAVYVDVEVPTYSFKC